jgi:hypothetical protein
LHGRGEDGTAELGGGNHAQVEVADVAGELLGPADAVVVVPAVGLEACPGDVLGLLVHRLGFLAPQQPQVLVGAGLLQVRGDPLAQLLFVQAVVGAVGPSAPDRGIDAGRLLGEHVAGRDPGQRGLEYLVLKRHSGGILGGSESACK